MRAAGVPDGPAMGVALSCIPRAVKQLGREGALARLAEVAATPERFEDEVHFGALAQRLVADQREADRRFVERDAPAPFANYCGDADPGALDQMRNSLRLPSALRGALMPDAHRGYGLPIGGVLETEGTVIPYAVGVDIACRMKLSVLDLDPAALDDGAHLEQALLKQTQFGTGAKLRKRADHATMEDERWTLTPLAARLRDRASDQLGTSGSGNHFVEFGLLTLPEPDLGLPAGRYVALLSHSGSRGAGAQIAGHYSKLARELRPELPKELSYLSVAGPRPRLGPRVPAADAADGRLRVGLPRRDPRARHRPPEGGGARRASRTITTTRGPPSATAARWSCTARARRRPRRASWA